MTSINHVVREDENDMLDAKKMLRGATRRPALGDIKGKNDIASKNTKPTGFVEMAAKKLSAAVRPALGDVSNKRSDAVIKVDSYKNVKARVDCWKKEVAVKQMVTRSKVAEPVKPPTAFVRATNTQKTSILGRQSVRAKITELPKLSVAIKVGSGVEPLIKSRTPQKSASIEMTDTFMQTHSAKMLAQVENIDERDKENPQLVSEYANDIYSYLYSLERDFPIRENYLDGHAEVTPKMRAILIDWINEVHLQFKLEIESYHMAVSIIDRYLQVARKTERNKLQLVGVTALFFATKYEELFPPAISDFTYICDDCYKPDEILEMERKMFRALKFNLSKPLSIHFLRRFSKAAKGDDRHHIFAKYIMELASVDYALVHRHSSEIAAASLYLALKVFPLKNAETGETQSPTWTPTLVFYSRYDNTHLIPITKRLAQLVLDAPSAKHKSVYLKYSSSKFDGISKNEALKNGVLEEIVSY